MNVLFVNMPFSSLFPSIGVSLLTSILKSRGIGARVEYLNLDYAARVGPETYRFLCVGVPSQALIGDYVFASCLSPDRGRDYDAYFRWVYDEFLTPDGHVAVSPHTFAVHPVASGERLRLLCETAGQFLDDCLERIDWLAYDVVGFTTTFAQNTASLALACRLKERYPQLTIVFGGANCEADMGLQLHRSFPFIDYVCSGESDESFPRLVEALAEGRPADDIPGVIYREGGESRFLSLTPLRVENLDALPYPDYDDFFEQSTAIGIDTTNHEIPVETSRGCWWGDKQHCTFCGLNGLTMTFRAKSPDRALQELISLSERYHTTNLFVVDNILSMRYLKDLLPELKRRSVGLDLFYETKANLTKEQIAVFRDAGISRVQPGIESLSTHVLRLMRKGTSALQNIQVLKWCRELGLGCTWNMLYGFPGETPEDYAEMIPLIWAIHHLQPPHACYPIRLDRFSPYFQDADAFGITAVRPAEAYQRVYDLPPEDLRNLAYYFDHAYADNRDPRTYVQEMLAAVRAWTTYYAWAYIRGGERIGLTYTDDGTTLSIHDTRWETPQAFTQLTGWQRSIYLYCDQNRSFQHIVTLGNELGATTGEIEAFLKQQVALRLMVSAEDRYLSLAVAYSDGMAGASTTRRAAGVMLA